MKYLMLIIMLFSVTATAEEIPSYMKDGEIVVTLKNGKQYKFSTNEFMVVKRGAKKAAPLKASAAAISAPKAQPARDKNIVSLEVLRSQNGLTSGYGPSMVDVESKYKIGAGLMYQRNVKDNLYLGGRIDSNGGTGVNVGVGF